MSDLISPEALRVRRFRDGPVAALRDKITRAVHEFVTVNYEEPEVLRELLACLASECGSTLYGLRDVPNAREIFSAMVSQAISLRAMLPVETATSKLGHAGWHLGADDRFKAEEQAAAAIDVATMRPAIDRYGDLLERAGDEFMTSLADVPTMWIAVLSCLGKEVADRLHGLREVPGARAVFDQVVTDMLALDQERAA